MTRREHEHRHPAHHAAAVGRASQHYRQPPHRAVHFAGRQLRWSHLRRVAVRLLRHPVMRRLTDMMDLGRRWIIADRDPIRHWGSGRVTLLGDAAHPVIQSYAQGACMAIEDGVALAELVARGEARTRHAADRSLLIAARRRKSLRHRAFMPISVSLVLDLGRQRRYIPPTFRQAVSFASRNGLPGPISF